MLWIIHLILRFYPSGQPPSGPSKQLHPAKPNQALGLQTGVVSGSRVGSRRALCSIARIQIGNRHEKTAATEYPLDWRWTPGLGPGRLGKRFGISGNTHTLHAQSFWDLTFGDTKDNRPSDERIECFGTGKEWGCRTWGWISTRLQVLDV